MGILHDRKRNCNSVASPLESSAVPMPAATPAGLRLVKDMQSDDALQHECRSCRAKHRCVRDRGPRYAGGTPEYRGGGSGVVIAPPKESVMSWIPFVSLLTLVTLSLSPSTEQKRRDPLPESFTATAQFLGEGGSAATTLKIRVERYTPDAEREAVLQSLTQG